MPKAGENQRPTAEPCYPESAREARKDSQPDTRAEKAKRLSYEAGIPVRAAEIILDALAKRDARIAALEARVTALEHPTCGCPQAE